VIVQRYMIASGHRSAGETFQLARLEKSFSSLH
jgi:hypothetical protein